MHHQILILPLAFLWNLSGLPLHCQPLSGHHHPGMPSLAHWVSSFVRCCPLSLGPFSLLLFWGTLEPVVLPYPWLPPPSSPQSRAEVGPSTL